eukprot:54658-Amphidinium_carterae.2
MPRTNASQAVPSGACTPTGGGEASASTSTAPTGLPDAPRTGAPRMVEAASSSTAAAPTYILPPCSGLTEAVIVSDDDETPAQGDTPPAATGGPPQKRRRTAWNKLQIPPHIVVGQDQLAQRVECGLCGARATMQYRVQFVRTHSTCIGIDAKLSAGKMSGSCRAHARLKRVHESLALPDNDPLQLCAVWHLQHGKLPRHIVQHEDFGQLTCMLCAGSGVNASRKNFITRHMKCLRAIATVDATAGTVAIDEGELQISAQRTAAGMTPRRVRKAAKKR